MRFISIRQLTTVFFISLFLQAPVDVEAESFKDSVVGIEFVFIETGSFLMGDTTGKDSETLPVKEVHIAGFYVGKHEVTFEQYDKFCDATDCNSPDDEGWGRKNRPVINVSWDDAQAFVVWLNSQATPSTEQDLKFKPVYRLPSESEWEYAARGSTNSLYWWGDKLGKNQANCRDCGSEWDGKMTAPVGSFKPNQYGLYDVSGNAYEWTEDAYSPNYNDLPTDGSALTDSDNKFHVDRSGSWYRPAQEITPSRRCSDLTKERNKETGFRLAMDLIATE